MRIQLKITCSKQQSSVQNKFKLKPVSPKKEILTNIQYRSIYQSKKRSYLSKSVLEITEISGNTSLANLYLKMQDFLNNKNFTNQIHTALCMQNQITGENQPVYYLFVPTFPSTTSSFTTLLLPTLPSHASFYRNTEEEGMSKGHQENNIDVRDQEVHKVAEEDSLKATSKAMRQKKASPLNQEYNPKGTRSKASRKRVYQKDEQRNILPNALSKLFFFLKSVGKSKNLLTKILQSSKKLGKYITPSLYYSYHNLMKSKMERFLTIDSLKFLFLLNDPEYTYFSLEQQLSIIKINGIMVRNFIKNNMYLIALVNSPRSPKNKLKAYITKYRIIENKASQFLSIAKTTYDFDLFEHKDHL